MLLNPGAFFEISNHKAHIKIFLDVIYLPYSVTLK